MVTISFATILLSIMFSSLDSRARERASSRACVTDNKELSAMPGSDVSIVREPSDLLQSLLLLVYCFQLGTKNVFAGLVLLKLTLESSFQGTQLVAVRVLQFANHFLTDYTNRSASGLNLDSLGDQYLTLPSIR